MRQHIDIDALYASALRRVQRVTDEPGAPRPAPDGCPFDLDDVLAGEVPELLLKLQR